MLTAIKPMFARHYVVAIRRQKLDRKANLTIDGDRVFDMPPTWAFTIDCPHHGKIAFDFTPFREHGRDDLAGHMRDAILSLRHEVVGATLKSYENSGMRTFWRFLDDLGAVGEFVIRLDQIDRKLIDRYLLWIELQIVTQGKNKGQKWLPCTQKRKFDYIKSLLENRQKHLPAVVNPALNYPRNPYPNINKRMSKREAYSSAEQKQILDALNRDLRTIHEGDGEPLSDLQVLVVHLLIFGLATGRNLQPLLELRRDSLQDHPLPDRELLVTFKRRGWSSHATSIRKEAAAPESQQTLQSIPANIGEHLRFLCEFTSHLVEEAEDEDRDFAFLWRVSKQQRKGQVVRLDAGRTGQAVKLFARRHGLTNDQGQPLALNVSRTRPTFATELYRRTHDIRRVQQALGHARVETTVRHYADKPFEAERDHAIVLDGMVSQFTHMEIDGKVLLAADGTIPLQDMKDLLAGGYNTGIARCRNPFREKESVCKKFFACFKCPSMCVFEDDLWRLFSFYYRLLAERDKINPAHWLKTYGPIIRRTDTDIASQFPLGKVEAARLKAQQTPHPTWRGATTMSLHLFDLRPIKDIVASEKANLPVSITIQSDGTQLVVSRFGDDIWDFYPYIPQENLQPAQKRIDWRIQLPDGRLLTDPEHAALRESAKTFIWSLFTQPVEGRQRSTMVTLVWKVKDLVPLLRWMVSTGLHCFANLAGHTLDYVPFAKLKKGGDKAAEKKSIAAFASSKTFSISAISSTTLFRFILGLTSRQPRWRG
jgi:integrase